MNLDTRPDDPPDVDIAAGRKLHDELLASKPEGASHNADICPFCVDKATEDVPTVPDPSRSGGPDATSTSTVPDDNGGRDNPPMSDISQEAHEALLTKAVADATSVTEKALEAKTNEAAEFKSKADTAEAELATAKTENDRLNADLDKAQVELQAARDEVADLKKQIADAEAATAKAEVAAERAKQVTNLGLYEADYVAERASSWADLSAEDWSARLDEWSKLKPVSTEGSPASDAASAMSGSTESLTKEPKTDSAAGDTTPKSSRRAALGLVN